MKGSTAQLDGGQELAGLSQNNPYLYTLLRRMIDGINTAASAAGVSAVGNVTPPPSPDTVTVQGTLADNVITCPSEILHWTITHNQAVNKGIRYFSEVDTDPNVPQPHVIDHGPGKTGFLTLPTFQNDGATQQTYYLRSYAQYTGSDPSKPTVVGGLKGATLIRMTGTSATTLLSSTGSGTASTTGQQGGAGLGKVQSRPKPGPKRSVGVIR